MKHLRNAIYLASLAAVGSVLGADASRANLQLIMLTKVNPQGLAIWDITNGAMDAKGDVVASKVTAAQWANLLEIGKSLAEAGLTLATSNEIVAAAPGAKLQDESNAGASTAADVQRYLNAKPAAFRAHAVALQKTGAAVIEAATKRDAKGLSALSNSLDGVCENCHAMFWYPQQKK